MSDNTPKSKEEMDKALNDLQLDPADLEAVVGGDCETCYSKYTTTKPVIVISSTDEEVR